MTKGAPKIKYLTNRDLLAAIHESKTTFCSFVDSKYARFDIIAYDLNSVTSDMIEAARQKRMSVLLEEQKKAIKAKTLDQAQPIDEIPLEDIVIRLMTFDHVPLNLAKLEKAKTLAERHTRCNFPPFQHFVHRDGAWHCVGKSHWRGGLENGYFSLTHGRVTNGLGIMWIKLSDRYGHRGNWRGYCVDQSTQALTQRGWLGIDEIAESDQIMSFDGYRMRWSSIKSIYRGQYNGLMHHLTNTAIDALITPNHKMVTTDGLVPAELLTENQHLVLMGECSPDGPGQYQDQLVELMGWIATEGCVESDHAGIKRITIYQNQGAKADRIRACLTALDFKFSESVNSKGNICFGIGRADSRQVGALMPLKTIPMSVLLTLTQAQRELLINTLVDGDGWRRGSNMSFGQKSKDRVDMFQALCALAGLKTNSHLNHNARSFDKTTSYYTVNVFSRRRNHSKVKGVDFHGGKRNRVGAAGRGKHHHPNVPTTPYTGMVWCPETEFGCFLARRNGKVYLTGNTYVEEMKAQALVQLSQVGLQFDEAKSSNAFSYYTSVIHTSFLKILHQEKKSQTIRDDLLIMHGASPSHTRVVEDQMAQRAAQEAADGPIIADAPPDAGDAGSDTPT